MIEKENKNRSFKLDLRQQRFACIVSISIYSLSDLGVSGNLIGSLSRSN